GQAGGTCRHRRVERHARDALNVECRQRAAWIEPVPAEPENQAADGAEDDVVRQHRAAAVAGEDAPEPRAEHNRACQRDGAADRVDDGRSREITKRSGLHDREPAVWSPGPMADDRIDEASDADAVKNVADEPAAADHRARRNRRTRVSERELKY